MADTASQTSQNEIVVVDEETYAKYILWKAIPPFIKKPPADRKGNVPTSLEFAESMGIDDPDILELVSIPTQTAFAQLHGISRETLSIWNRKLKTRDDMADMRTWARALSRNMLTSLYNHAIRKGNPLNIKLWFELVNGWESKSKVEHNYKGITQFTVIHNGKPKDSIAQAAPEVLRAGDGNPGWSGSPADAA